MLREESSQSTTATATNGFIQSSGNQARVDVDESTAMLGPGVVVCGGGANTSSGLDDNNHTVVLHPMQFDHGGNEKGCCWRLAGGGGGTRRPKSTAHRCMVITLATSVAALVCFILVVFLNPTLFFKLNSK
jgi:hypothetical protein